MRRITERASKELLAVPASATSARTSAAPRSPTKSSAPNFTELWISLDPDVDYEATVAKVQSIVDGYPGLLPRSAHLSAGAHQGSADRRQRDDRRAHLRAGPRRLQAQAQAVGKALADVARRRRPQGRSRRCSCRRSRCASGPSGRRCFGLTAGDVRRAGDDARAGHQGRRVLRGSEALRRRRLGRARDPRRTSKRSRALQLPLAGRVDRAAEQRRRRAGHAGAERDHARERRRAGST